MDNRIWRIFARGMMWDGNAIAFDMERVAKDAGQAWMDFARELPAVTSWENIIVVEVDQDAGETEEGQGSDIPGGNPEAGRAD
jgi:hypothetical protein